MQSRYWSGLNISEEILENHNDEITRLIQGEWHGLNVEKLINSNPPLYSFRTSLKGRVLFTIENNILIILEELPNHEYDKSKFLKNPKLIGRYISTLDLGLSFEEYNASPTPITNPSHGQAQRVILHNHSFITPSPTQLSVINQTQAQLIIGPAGCGKTLILAAKMADAASQPNQTIYIATSPYLVNKLQQEYQDTYADASQRTPVSFQTYENFIRTKFPHLEASKFITRKDIIQHILSKLNTKGALKNLFTENQDRFSKERFAEIIYQEWCLIATIPYASPDPKTGRKPEIKDYLTQGDRLSFFTEKEHRQCILDNFSAFNKNSSGKIIIDFVIIEESEPKNCHYLVDEAQNLPPAATFNFARTGNNITVVLDPNQQCTDVISKTSLIKSALYQYKLIPVNTILTDGYRCSQLITAMANRLLAIKRQITGGTHCNEEPTEISSKNSEPGEIDFFRSLDKNLKDYIKLASKNANFAILVPNQKAKDDVLKNHPQVIQVYTFDEVGGLEFDTVLIFDPLSDKNLIDALTLYKKSSDTDNTHKSSNDADTRHHRPALNAFQTAVTRARNNLHLYIPKLPHNLIDVVHSLFPTFNPESPVKTEPKPSVHVSTKEEWIERARQLIQQEKLKKAIQILKSQGLDESSIISIFAEQQVPYPTEIQKPIAPAKKVKPKKILLEDKGFRKLAKLSEDEIQEFLYYPSHHYKEAPIYQLFRVKNYQGLIQAIPEAYKHFPVELIFEPTFMDIWVNDGHCYGIILDILYDKVVFNKTMTLKAEYSEQLLKNFKTLWTNVRDAIEAKAIIRLCIDFSEDKPALLQGIKQRKLLSEFELKTSTELATLFTSQNIEPIQQLMQTPFALASDESPDVLDNKTLCQALKNIILTNNPTNTNFTALEDFYIDNFAYLLSTLFKAIGAKKLKQATDFQENVIKYAQLLIRCLEDPVSTPSLEIIYNNDFAFIVAGREQAYPMEYVQLWGNYRIWAKDEGVDPVEAAFNSQEKFKIFSLNIIFQAYKIYYKGRKDQQHRNSYLNSRIFDIILMMYITLCNTLYPFREKSITLLETNLLPEPFQLIPTIRKMSLSEMEAYFFDEKFLFYHCLTTPVMAEAIFNLLLDNNSDNNSTYYLHSLVIKALNDRYTHNNQTTSLYHHIITTQPGMVWVLNNMGSVFSRVASQFYVSLNKPISRDNFNFDPFIQYLHLSLNTEKLPAISPIIVQEYLRGLSEFNSEDYHCVLFELDIANKRTLANILLSLEISRDLFLEHLQNTPDMINLIDKKWLTIPKNLSLFFEALDKAKDKKNTKLFSRFKQSAFDFSIQELTENNCALLGAFIHSEIGCYILRTYTSTLDKFTTAMLNCVNTESINLVARSYGIKLLYSLTIRFPDLLVALKINNINNNNVIVKLLNGSLLGKQLAMTILFDTQTYQFQSPSAQQITDILRRISERAPQIQPSKAMPAKELTIVYPLEDELLSQHKALSSFLAIYHNMINSTAINNFQFTMQIISIIQNVLADIFCVCEFYTVMKKTDAGTFLPYYYITLNKHPGYFITDPKSWDDPNHQLLIDCQTGRSVTDIPEAIPPSSLITSYYCFFTKEPKLPTSKPPTTAAATPQGRR